MLTDKLEEFATLEHLGGILLKLAGGRLSLALLAGRGLNGWTVLAVAAAWYDDALTTLGTGGG